MGVVKCHNLVKKYGRNEVLRIDELEIKEGAITGLVGRNGAGKTTLLHIIAGFTRKTVGDITVFDYEPFDHLQVSVNSIFIDDQMLFPEHITLGMILKEMEQFYPNWDAALATGLFDHFDFDARSYHKQLSKGKRSTFNTIIGLAARSPLTIFDEPTVGMDVAVRKDFYRALLRDYVAHPRTIIISSHHLNELEDLLEKVILIDEGSVKLHLEMDALRHYATGITGDAKTVRNWAENKPVLYEEKVGSDSLYVVVQDHVLADEIAPYGFKRSVVSPADIAIYMTRKKAGGIDDIFDDS